MHVAVLGATGVAGRAFVPKALGHGHTLQTDRVDIFDVDGLEAALRGCDAAVNLVTSIPRPGAAATGRQTIASAGTAHCHRVACSNPPWKT